MTASIEDIRLNIVLGIQGMTNLTALNSALSSYYTRQSTATRGASAATAAVKAQNAQLNTLHGRLTAAEQAYDAVFRASYRLQIVGYSLLGVSRDILGVISDTTDAWGKFEFMVNRAAGALQVWRNAGSSISPLYNGLIDRVQALTKELRLFPAEDVAKATYFWASTSGQAVKTQQDLVSVMSSVNPLMKIAALTQTSYESAIKGVYSILVQYGKGLGDVGDVTNKLFLVTQRTALEFPDLINAFKFVGPVAGQMGVTFEEVAGVLGALGDAGIRGTMAGRALRQVFIQLERPTAKAQAAMEALFKSTQGIRKGFQETVFPNGQFVGLTNFVHLLAVALKDATQEQRGHLLATISTANELSVLSSLVGEEIKRIKGVGGAYDSSKASVLDAAYAATQFQKAWGLLADSWVGITGRIKAGIEIIRLNVGRGIAEALKPAVAQFTLMLDKIEIWVRKNPELVQTFTKIAGFVAVFAGIAGATLVLAGSLLGLFAAINVLRLGFARIIPAISVVTGWLTIFGEAIVRNWNFIVRTLTPAFENLAAALGLNKDGLEGAKKAWDDLHSTLRTITDYIVRNVVRAIATITDFFASILRQGSPVRSVLEAIGKALLLAFSIQVIATITGLAKVLSVIFSVLAVVRAGAVSTAVGLGLLRVQALFAAGGVKSLFIALQTMSKTTVLIFLTAFIAGMQWLHDNVPVVGDFLDNLFKSATQNAAELNSRFQDFLDTVGKPLAKPLSDSINSLVESTGHWATKITEVRDRLANLPPMGDKVRASLDLKLGNLLEGQAAAVKDWGDRITAAADSANVSVSQFSGTMLDWVKQFRFDLPTATTAVTEWFKIIGDGTPTVANAIKYWNQFGKAFASKGISASDFLQFTVPADAINKFAADIKARTQIALAAQDISKGQYNLGYAILKDLVANSSQYSDDVNAAVTNLVGKVPQALKGIVDQAQQIASDAPGDIAKALIDGVKNIGDIQKSFADALKSTLDPKHLVAVLFGTANLRTIEKGFLSTHLGMYDWATAQIKTLNDTFSAAVAAAMDSNQTETLARQILANYTGPAFTKAFGKGGQKLSPEMKSAIQGWVDWANQQLGLITPSPAVVATTTDTIKKNIPKWLAYEMSGAVAATGVVSPGADALKTAVAGMKTAWTEPSGGAAFLQSVGGIIKTTLSTNNFQGGFNTFSSWFQGVLKAFNTYEPTVTQRLLSLKRQTQGYSPPPEGPLKDIDTGGYNVGKAWSSHFVKGLGLAIKGTRDVTSEIGSLYSDIPGATSGGSMTVNSSQMRRVKVEVDVSSKDGSVSNLDLKALSAVITPEVMREVEHMAAVI